MATTRDLLNKVLRGLRQEEIASGDTSTTDSYHVLLTQMLNEAKEEVEEAWDWYALRQTVTVTLAQGTSDYELLIASDSDVDTNDRTRLLYEKGAGYNITETSSRGAGALPMVFDVTDAAEFRLSEMPLEWIERQHFLDNDEQNKPEYFALYQDSDAMRLRIYPTPDAVRTIKLRLLIPQAALDNTSLDTTLTIPARPVWTRALYKANEERGSELGRPGSSLSIAAYDALFAAITKEGTPFDFTSFPE